MFTATMSFGQGADIDALRETVHRWGQDWVKPKARQIDTENCFPQTLLQEIGALGLLGITVPEEYGGAGLGYLAYVIAVEEIARTSASVALSYGPHSNLCVNQIALNGTPPQKTRYLPDLVSGTHVGALAMSKGTAPVPVDPRISTSLVCADRTWWSLLSRMCMFPRTVYLGKLGAECRS